MGIGEVIRVERKKQSLSQRALAKMLGVAPSAVGQWETDKTKPALKHRVELADILNIQFGDLVPEAVGEISSRDPRTIILVRQFEKLPPKLREVLLRQVIDISEAIASTHE